MPTVNKVSRHWVRTYEQTKVHDSFYNSAPWRNLRRIVLAEDPLCYYCKQTGRTTIATILDHFKPKKLFPELSLVKENLKGCCDYHHQVKRQWEKGISTREQFELLIHSFIDRITKSAKQ